MGKILKWIGIGLAVLIGLVLVLVIVVYGWSNYRLNKTYTIQPEAIPIPTDAAAIERGQHIALAIGKCGDCHGQKLEGKVFIDAPPGFLVAPNLTSGQGGVEATFTDADWVRAIRHGVDPQGRPLLFMPAQEFNYLSDSDLGDLIAYVKSVPPVDNQPPVSYVRPLGRVLHLAGQLDLLPAELIDHTGPRPVAPEPGVTVEYGAYLANIGCHGCHGPGLSGGQIPGTPPGDPAFPPATNLTPGGDTKGWTEADFMTAMRTGVRPDGRPIDPFMPWAAIGQMTDDELKATWLYLQSVPPKASGNR
jgi:mono/diheme cytochrome c family protein